MSRNIYDPATDTLTPIAGCNGMDSDFSSTSQNALKNSVITNAMGALSSLSTSNKSSLVNAINEVNTKSINNQGNFAYINTNSTTASKAYTSGEQFILDGVLRRAKTAIASGATLTLNSNYENAPSVTSQISNLAYHQTGEVVNFYCVAMGISNANGTNIAVYLNLPKRIVSSKGVSQYSIDIPWIRANGVNITSGYTINGILVMRENICYIEVVGTFQSMTIYGLNIQGTITIP